MPLNVVKQLAFSSERYHTHKEQLSMPYTFTWTYSLPQRFCYNSYVINQKYISHSSGIATGLVVFSGDWDCYGLLMDFDPCLDCCEYGLPYK